MLSSQSHRNIGSCTMLISMLQLRHHLRKGYKQHVQISVYNLFIYLCIYLRSTLNVIRNSSLFQVQKALFVKVMKG